MTSTPTPKQPKPTAAHRRLEVFICDWDAEGTSYGDGQDAADPCAADVPGTSDECYEWLPVGFFLLHQWDAKAVKRIFNGTEIIGYDDAKDRYFTRFFRQRRQPSRLCRRGRRQCLDIYSTADTCDGHR